MRRGALIAVALACVGSLASVAHADDADAPPPTMHKGQFGLSLRFGGGLRGIAASNHDYCGQTDANGNATVCTGGTPLAFDVEASYGILPHIELALSLTLGIQHDFGMSPGTNGPFPLRLGFGPRLFVSEATHSQFFIQPMLMGDFANYRNPSGGVIGDAVGVRTLEGFWIDLHRAYGFYVYVGETAEFVRWIDGEVEAGIGIQGRYP